MYNSLTKIHKTLADPCPNLRFQPPKTTIRIGRNFFYNLLMNTNHTY